MDSQLAWEESSLVLMRASCEPFLPVLDGPEYKEIIMICTSTSLRHACTAANCMHANLTASKWSITSCKQGELFMNVRHQQHPHYYIFGVGKETAFEALVGSTPSGIY